MAVVMETERVLGYEPSDVSREKRGYDLESRIPRTGRLRFIEVKGRVAGAQTVIVTKNEILTALNKPDDFILAIVVVNRETATPGYIRRPFQREPHFGVTSVNYNVEELLARAASVMSGGAGGKRASALACGEDTPLGHCIRNPMKCAHHANIAQSYAVKAATVRRLAIRRTVAAAIHSTESHNHGHKAAATTGREAPTSLSIVA